MSNVFVICPVRNATKEWKDSVDANVKQLENEGNTVYYPPRDTVQDVRSLDICEQNRRAMEEADIVYIAWDGKSLGCLFDLGMAFAMRKRVSTIIGLFPAMSDEKSFQNLVYQMMGVWAPF